MCKVFAYCRVSTSDKSSKQNYERQRYLLEHSGIHFDEIFEEHISGGVKGNQREQFNKMLEQLNEKDLVCFTETSRFGRNYIDCFEMLDIITQNFGASVKFLSNGIKFEGGEKMNPYEWMTISQFFIQDEFLKRQIGYNTKVALARKRELIPNFKIGREKTTSKDLDNKVRDKYFNRHNLGISSNDIIKEFGLTSRVFYRIVNEK